MQIIKAVLLALALSATQGALAHTDEYLDTVKAPHGGQLRMAGAYHFELVAKENELTVFVTDHGGKKFDTNGAIGSAIMLSGKTKATVPLTPAGDNGMKGGGKFALVPDMKVIISISMPGEAAQQARFTPGQKPQAATE